MEFRHHRSYAREGLFAVTDLRAVEASTATLDLDEPLSQADSLLSVSHSQQRPQGISRCLHTRGGAFAARSAGAGGWVCRVRVFITGTVIAQETCSWV